MVGTFCKEVKDVENEQEDPKGNDCTRLKKILQEMVSDCEGQAKNRNKWRS